MKFSTVPFQSEYTRRSQILHFVDRASFLVNDQRDAQIPFYVFILFITLYMFPAHRAHHQERQIVSIHPLVTVTLCEWPCLVQVGSRLVW